MNILLLLRKCSEPLELPFCTRNYQASFKSNRAQVSFTESSSALANGITGYAETFMSPILWAVIFDALVLCKQSSFLDSVFVINSDQAASGY